MPSEPVGLETEPARPLRVLIIEDYDEDALLLRRHLARAGYAVQSRQVQTAEELHDALATDVWDLVIADYTLPSFGARDALRIIQQSGHDLPFIIVSGTIDEVSAVDAMRAGAHDYVLKGHLERLLPAIERELADADRRRQRLATEAELRLAEQRFSATFNQAAVGMAHTSIDGHFLMVNQLLTEMFGLTEKQILSLRKEDFVIASQRTQTEADLQSLLSGSSNGIRVERTLVRSNGETFPAQVTGSLLRHGPDNTESTILWVIEDISARKAAERESTELMTRLINSERLAAGGRMANTLAHEINNPLEALTNIFYILGVQEDLSPETRDLIAVGARELDRVGYITRSTLSFYRKVPGRTLDLHAMLEEVVQLFTSRARQHGIDLVTALDVDTREARFDPSLRQVFANIVGNALEAMQASGGGRIVIRAHIRQARALVTIGDSGHGIPHENFASIFEPFFTTKGERGTGLGLWVTRGIIEEHGGTLQVRSSTRGPRRGTTMRVTLPVKDLPADDAAASGESA